MTTNPHSTRKVKKTITEITPEVKLQELSKKKHYSRNGNSILWSTVRMGMVIGMIVGAFILGVRVGFGDFESTIRENPPSLSVDPMISQCQLIPDMAGCEKYNARRTAQQAPDPMNMSMNGMQKMLLGKTGDILDRAFLTTMIAHHQGAVDMALTLTGTEHGELIKLSEDIVAAQTKEIEQMKKWQEEWGYTATGKTASGVIRL